MGDGFLAKPFGAWEVAAAVAGLLAPGAGIPAPSEPAWPVAARADALA
jgi:hypothetical protein